MARADSASQQSADNTTAEAPKATATFLRRVTTVVCGDQLQNDNNRGNNNDNNTRFISKEQPRKLVIGLPDVGGQIY